MHDTFQLEPFRPARLWLNPHSQTILANSLRSTSGVFFRRTRLDTPDGDFLDIDFAIIPGTELAPDAPLVLLLHGLEGSARRSYACETYRQLARRGIRAVGMNYRGCSGEPNRTRRLYHAGATDDVALVVDWLAAQYPDAPLGMVGFSLGGNMLLKYVGEQGTKTLVRVAAAVSPPFDLARGIGTFHQGEGRMYASRFMESLQQKAVAHAGQNGHSLDIEGIMAAKTFLEFDELVTAPLHGFNSAADYYAQASSAQYLPGIAVPTLIIRAMDDPFFAPDIPHRRLAANENLLPAMVPHGGHVAFAEGVWPRRFSYWAERQAARFLAAFLID